jgi:predicted RNA binding protein with dsRBD fold (UPF0201 family)
LAEKEDSKLVEPQLDISIVLKTEVKPSEDSERIEESIAKVFPQVVKDSEDGLFANRLRMEGRGTQTIVRFREQLKARRIRAAARRLLSRNKRGDATWVYLNKQALVSGTVALCERPDESPLGPVILELKSNQLPDVIEWLAQMDVRAREKGPR